MPYGPSDEQRLDILPATAGGRRGTIVFVHGGGFTDGDRSLIRDPEYRPILTQRSRGFDLVSIDYRLAPRHLFPAAFHDVALAVRWVRELGPAYGLSTERIVLVGHSAGGSLAAMVGTSPGASTPYGPVQRVDAWIAVSAITDFVGRDTWRDFVGDWGLVHPDVRRSASPINSLDPTDPPGHLIQGDRDRIVPVRHSTRLTAHADRIGASVDLDLVDHGPSGCRGHGPLCAADQAALDTFIG